MRQSRRIVAALLDHLQGGRPMPPAGSAPVWSAFRHLCLTRTWHAHGPNPISYAEIDAYCRLMRQPLEPHHVETICAMDQAWLSVTLPSSVAARNERISPRTSQHALTPALLDTMFR